MKFIMVAALALLLAGCQHTSYTPTQYKQIIVKIPENLYQCPGMPAKPNVATMTDSQVASFITRLWNSRSRCAASLQAIRSFEDKTSAALAN